MQISEFFFMLLCLYVCECEYEMNMIYLESESGFEFVQKRKC